MGINLIGTAESTLSDKGINFIVTPAELEEEVELGEWFSWEGNDRRTGYYDGVSREAGEINTNPFTVTHTDERVASNIALSPERLFYVVGDDDTKENRVIAVNRETGTGVWTTDQTELIYTNDAEVFTEISGVHVQDGRVYLGTSDLENTDTGEARVVALDEGTGEVLWEVDPTIGNRTPLRADEMVLVEGNKVIGVTRDDTPNGVEETDYTLYAVNKETGITQWNFRNEDIGFGNFVPSSPAADSDNVYILAKAPDEDFRLSSVNVFDGTEEWEVTVRNDDGNIPGDFMKDLIPTVGEDKVFVIGSREVAAFDDRMTIEARNKIDGSMEWEYITEADSSQINTSTFFRFIGTSVTTDGENVYYGHDDQLITLDAETGNEVSDLTKSFDSGDKFGIPISVDNNYLYIPSTDDDRIRVVDKDDGTSVDYFRPGNLTPPFMDMAFGATLFEGGLFIGGYDSGDGVVSRVDFE